VNPATFLYSYDAYIDGETQIGKDASLDAEETPVAFAFTTGSFTDSR
jgi:hypothetical protein